MKTPAISVIMPVFNASPWVLSAVESILTQDVGPVELIVVDDASTDAGVDRVVAHFGRHATLKILRNETNLGIVGSLNRALDVAQGRYIARMDADDISEPGRLRTQMHFLDSSGLHMCGSWFLEFGQGVSRRIRWPHTQPAVHAALLFQNTICHPTLFARREVFERFRYRPEYQLAEDYDLFSRAMTYFRMANVPEVLLRYRRHDSQATQAKRHVMEEITQRIRLNCLHSQGIFPTQEQARLHQLIRAPSSIRELGDLRGIELWLLQLCEHSSSVDAREIIASQWVRACIRAAPLGMRMWQTFHRSRLCGHLRGRWRTHFDLMVLAATRLDYASGAYARLRRLGLSM